ncbi:MAG: ATP-binding cassette domain-containing protein [Desulfovibrio sp.]|nr:ATP-binding cassette domain-containing protein [Desulfovibrio sp.]
MLYKVLNLIKRRAEVGYTLLIKKLSLETGEIVVLRGPSGCGKSTTLDLLGLVLEPDQAESFEFSPKPEVNYKLLDLYQARKLEELAKLRSEHLGYVLQTGELLPFISVEENLLIPALLKGLPRKEVLARARELAKELGLLPRLKVSPNSLSVGERQRVAIIRALLARPALILADEPTAALDPISAEKVMQIFASSAKSLGTTLLVVSHNPLNLSSKSFRELTFVLKEDKQGLLALLSEESS